MLRSALAFVVGAVCLTSVTAEDPFNSTYALRATHLAGAAYCPKASIQSWSGPDHCKYIPHMTDITVVEHVESHNQGYVGYDPDMNQVIVSIRGTVSTSIKNWIADLTFFKKTPPFNCNGCQVHEGFLNDTMFLYQPIQTAVDSILKTQPSADLVVTGHSLGAAMAVLTASFLYSSGHTISAVYTMGQPRTGDDAFYSWYMGAVPTHYRLVHHDDVVVHLPPESFGFHHTRREIWYTEDSSSYYTADGSGEDAHGSDSVHFYDYSVDDHLEYCGVPIGSSSC